MPADVAVSESEPSSMTEPSEMSEPRKVSSAKGGKGNAELTTGDVLRKILPAAAGSFMEFYEFAIFSYMSTEITGNFFAGHGGSLGTWAGFAITFLARPLGGLFFGWIGDRFGRGPAMRLTIAVMLVTTFVQGLLPTFYCCGESWGWVGMGLMLFIRVFQGLSAGGELSTAAVYITEVSPRERLGFNLSWISVTGAFGAWVVAALVVFCCETILSKDAMLLWGWRLPYLSSIIPGALIILGRKNLQETPEFEENKAKSMETDAEAGGTTTEVQVLKELFANHKLALLIGGFGTAIFGALSFVPPLYGVKFLKDYDGLPDNVVTFSQMINYLIPAALSPAVGMLVDEWGAGRTYTLSVFLGGILAPLPLLYWWAHTPPAQAIATVFAGQAIIGLCLALTTSVYLWVVELFPVHVRVTGVSVAYNIGVGLFGGVGPLVSDFGNQFIDPRGPVSAPAMYTLVMGIFSLIACLASQALARRGKMRITHIRETPY